MFTPPPSNQGDLLTGAYPAASTARPSVSKEPKRVNPVSSKTFPIASTVPPPIQREVYICRGRHEREQPKHIKDLVNHLNGISKYHFEWRAFGQIKSNEYVLHYVQEGDRNDTNDLIEGLKDLKGKTKNILILFSNRTDYNNETIKKILVEQVSSPNQVIFYPIRMTETIEYGSQPKDVKETASKIIAALKSITQSEKPLPSPLLIPTESKEPASQPLKKRIEQKTKEDSKQNHLIPLRAPVARSSTPSLAQRKVYICCGNSGAQKPEHIEELLNQLNRHTGSKYYFEWRSTDQIESNAYVLHYVLESERNDKDDLINGIQSLKQTTKNILILFANYSHEDKIKEIKEIFIKHLNRQQDRVILCPIKYTHDLSSTNKNILNTCQRIQAALDQL